MSDMSILAPARFPPLVELIRRAKDAHYSDEYGVKLRRLFPWPERVQTKRPLTELGVMSVLVEPGKIIESHWHDEEEAFCVVHGEADLTIEGETTVLSVGDVAYIPRFARHAVANKSSADPFLFIDVYWDNRNQEACT